MICICLFNVSSPYLFVFGDDRVRGTRKQKMLQVDLVRRRVGAWAIVWIFYIVLLNYFLVKSFQRSPFL